MDWLSRMSSDHSSLKLIKSHWQLVPYDYHRPGLIPANIASSSENKTSLEVEQTRAKAAVNLSLAINSFGLKEKFVRSQTC